MENLEKDKKKRSLFRRNVTKLVNKVKDILDSPDVEDGLVEHLRKELLERQIELKEVDDKILDSLLEIEETEEQELDRESEEASLRESTGATFLAVSGSPAKAFTG
eukprot:gene2984-1242_t